MFSSNEFLSYILWYQKIARAHSSIHTSIPPFSKRASPVAYGAFNRITCLSMLCKNSARLTHLFRPLKMYERKDEWPRPLSYTIYCLFKTHLKNCKHIPWIIWFTLALSLIIFHCFAKLQQDFSQGFKGLCPIISAVDKEHGFHCVSRLIIIRQSLKKQYEGSVHACVGMICKCKSPWKPSAGFWSAGPAFKKG